jgi:ubiquinone/menaquinone biosynthesis C-methylase UbiE
VCNTQEELDSAIAELNEKLAPGRAIANGHRASILKGGDHQLPDDIIIQEYVKGSDFSCALVEMGNTPVALPPMIWRYPEDAKDQFLSWDVKWHPATHEEVFPRSENPDLFDRIRKAAEDAFYTNEMHGCSWCNVDLRVSDSGTITVIEVNPMPPIFQVGYKSADTVIEKFFPGGHKALLNGAIANFFLRNSSRLETVQRIAATYDGFAGEYDVVVSPQAGVTENIRDVTTKYAYDGVVLDLACGTGQIGRVHDEQNGAGKANFIGVDISTKMRDICLKHKAYEAVIVGPVQKILTAYTNSVDHIVCMGALHFLSTYELSMVLSRSFQLARSSVTFSVDEIPSVYNYSLKAVGKQHMESLDHLAAVEAFGTPVGWKLADRWRRFGWKSPHTGIEVYISVFRFERADKESFHWFMPEPKRKLSSIEPSIGSNAVADLDGGKAHVNDDINEILPPTMDDAPTEMISVA